MFVTLYVFCVMRYLLFVVLSWLLTSVLYFDISNIFSVCPQHSIAYPMIGKAGDLWTSIKNCIFSKFCSRAIKVNCRLLSEHKQSP